MNRIDPENAVVRLCVAGVQAEQAGEGEKAAERYTRAWDTRTNDLEASIAAHYVARAQSDPEARLRWNMVALEHAEAAGDAASSFLPSLHLNVGHSHEELGQLRQARASYERAHATLDGVDTGLAHSLRGPVERARRRVLAQTEAEAWQPGATPLID